jgi:hypothetical protein
VSPFAVLSEEIRSADRAQLDITATIYRYRLTERVHTPPAAPFADSIDGHPGPPRPLDQSRRHGCVERGASR